MLRSKLLDGVGVFFATMGIASVAPGQVIIDFPDENLEYAVRYALGKPTGPIYDLECAQLVVLYADSLGIRDLTGLEFCPNLLMLMLGYNEIDDLAPISGCNRLTDLSLYENLIDGIYPIEDASGMDWLDLGENRIVDVHPIGNMPYLTELGLDGNRIVDIDPLSRRYYLAWLLLNDNRISQIGALAGLGSLTGLDLDANGVSDIGPLVSNPGMGKGDRVTLRCNPLSAISIYSYIPTLEARGVKIAWIPPDAIECPEPARWLLLGAALGFLSMIDRGHKRQHIRGR